MYIRIAGANVSKHFVPTFRKFQNILSSRDFVFLLLVLFFFCFSSVTGIGDAQRGQQAPPSAAPSSSCGGGCVEAAEVASSAGSPPPGEACFFSADGVGVVDVGVGLVGVSEDEGT